MPRISGSQLNHLATCDRTYITALKAGEHLVATGYTVTAVLGRITADRIRLAAQLSREANALLGASQFRSAISRSYYAKYHTIRAVVYYMTPGDDHEAHIEVPKHIPGDFPARASWQQQLKLARLDRNRADYDPYPLSEKDFAAAATRMCTDCKALLTVARKYLRSKGCKL